MAARPKEADRRSRSVVSAIAVAGAATVLLVPRRRRQASAQQRRIVSLVPALTEMLFAIGAGPQVVGVSSFDAFPPEVKNLPRVGALLDPDTERILSLRPDLVIIYGSQTDLQTQFERAGIQHVRLPARRHRHHPPDDARARRRDRSSTAGRPRRAAISRNGSTPSARG